MVLTSFYIANRSYVQYCIPSISRYNKPIQEGRSSLLKIEHLHTRRHTTLSATFERLEVFVHILQRISSLRESQVGQGKALI